MTFSFPIGGEHRLLRRSMAPSEGADRGVIGPKESADAARTVEANMTEHVKQAETLLSRAQPESPEHAALAAEVAEAQRAFVEEQSRAARAAMKSEVLRGQTSAIIGEFERR